MLSPIVGSKNICLYVKFIHIYLIVSDFVFSAVLMEIGLNVTKMYLFWLWLYSFVFFLILNYVMHIKI